MFFDNLNFLFDSIVPNKNVNLFEQSKAQQQSFDQKFNQAYAEASKDFMYSLRKTLYPRYAASIETIASCSYCGGSLRLDSAGQCKGCGAPR